MQIIKRNKMKILLADEGKVLRNKEDIYTPAYVDENGNEIPENIPYTTDTIFLPLTLSDDEIREMYVEEDIEEE